MDRAPSRPSADAPAFDPRVTPLPRRNVLVLAGATILGGTALAAVLAGCQPPPPVTVGLDLDVAALPVGSPTLVEFAATLGATTVEASTWLVKRADGELIAYDPRCTHALCIYRWDDAADRFNCACHDGRFALDGTVLAGPPPHALDRWPVRQTASGIELDVPGDFVTPRESLG